MTDAAAEGLGITEIATLADVTPRTVRYYVAEGLLSPPFGSGQQRFYTQEHVTRLKAIRYLKDAFLPLSEIRRRLEKMTPEEVERLIEEGPPPAPSSALEYLATVTPDALPRRVRESQGLAPASPATPPAAPKTTWRRISLAPDLELQYQPTGDRVRESLIERVIEFATQLLHDRPPRRR